MIIIMIITKTKLSANLKENERREHVVKWILLFQWTTE